MATLKELYTALRSDGASLPADTYEEFEKYMTSGPQNGYAHRKEVYDELKEAGAPLPDTYEEFSRALFVSAGDLNGRKEKPTQTSPSAAASAREIKAAAPASAQIPSATPASAPASVSTGAPDQVAETMAAGTASPTAQEPVRMMSAQDSAERSDKGHEMEFYMKDSVDQSHFHAPTRVMKDPEDIYKVKGKVARQGASQDPFGLPEVVVTPQGAMSGKEYDEKQLEKELQEAYAERDELVRLSSERLAEIDKASGLDEQSVLSSILSSGDPMMGAMSATTSRQTQSRLEDPRYQQQRQAIRELNERIRILENRKYVMKGGDQGFWRSFAQSVSNPELWVGNQIGFLTASAKLAANANPDTDAAQRMLKAESDRKEAEQVFGDFGFFSRAGEMTAEMAPFMYDFATMGGTRAANSTLTRGLTALLLKGGRKVAPKLMNKGLAKFTVKALGAMPEELAFAAAMTNTVQSGKTAKDIVDRKLGDVVTDEKGNLRYADDKTWESAAWQGEANSIIENYSEMFGTHLDGVAKIPWKKLADVFGAKRLGAVMARADAQGYKRLLDASRRMTESLGVSDYTGEVAEEYYGQLWRTMLGLDDAYQTQPDGSRKNLLLTGQFHGDIWGGMALSMGLLGAGRTTLTAASYGSMRHEVNKADKKAQQVFARDYWENLRSQIDETPNDKIGGLAEGIISDGTLTEDQRYAAMDYMERSLNLRGLNLAELMMQRGGDEDADASDDGFKEELNALYLQGLNSTSPEDMAQAAGQYYAAQDRLYATFPDKESADDFIGNLDYAPAGVFLNDDDPDFDEKVKGYIRAKTVYDGMTQSERYAKELEAAEAAIGTPLGRAVMKFQDRPVEVLSGRVVMTEDGAMVDNERSGNTIVIRDVATGKMEMVSPDVILSYENYGDYAETEESEPAAEQGAEMAARTSSGLRPRHQKEAGAEAEPQSKYTSGQIKIRNSDGTETRGVLTGYVDENGNHEFYVEGDLQHLHYASDYELDNILSDYQPDAPHESVEPQQSADRPAPEGVTNVVDYDNGYSFGMNEAQRFSDEALATETGNLRNNAETLTDFGRGMLEAYEYEQQRRTLEAQPAPDPNAGLDGPRHAHDVGAPGLTKIEYPSDAEVLWPTSSRDGKDGHGLISSENDNRAVAYNLFNTATKATDWADFLNTMHQNGMKVSANYHKTLQAFFDAVKSGKVTMDESRQFFGHRPKSDVAENTPAPEPQQEPTPLQRIPRNQQGEPVFEQAESPEVGWDALVEFSEGDAATAKEIADTMTEEKRKAYEKAQKLKAKGKTPTEILASKKANAAQLAQAESEYNLWQRIAGVEQARQNAIRAQQEAEARQRAAERAEAEKAEREAREEAARIEREALEGIPEWHLDNPENARKRGMRRFSGQMFTRQEPVQGVVGHEVEVKFSQKDLPKGHVAVIEASQLQPSHIQGQRNPMFFIEEAQPKNRAEAVSMYAAKEMAEGIRPQEITGSATAYTGAPTINSRGEVIQGNNRSDALRYLWENKLPEQQQTYKQYLIDNAEQFGIDPEAVNAMQQPVLVNMLDVDDAEAIRLGQMTAQDTESGGIERIKPKNVAQKLGEDMRSFASQLLRSGDEEATFGQLVDRNGTEVLKWMAQKGAITDTQYQSAFDSKGNLTAEAKNDLQKVLYQAVFKGGSQQLEEMFDALPVKAQRAILSTAFRDMDSPFAGKMLPEIQASIAAYNQLMSDPSFVEAKNMEQVLRAIEGFKQAIALDDRFEQYVPADNFSNFALHLAAIYKANDMSQSTLTSYFNQMYDLAQGKKAATLFEEADTTEYPLADVIKKVLNIDYKPAKNGNNNVANGGADVALRNQDGQGGELRGNEPPAGGEQNPAGTEPSERGAGITGYSRGSGNIGNGGESQETTRQERLTKEAASGIIAEMEQRATVAPELELTIENWDAQFGENGIVSTPIGEVKMGENQFTKLMRQGRNGKLGMIRPTLEDPDIIIEDASEAKDNQTTERESSFVFVKTFTKPDGSRYYYFTSVTVSKDGHEVVVSNQEKRRNVLTNLLMKGKLVWKHADNVSPASDVADGLYSSQGNLSDPASEGTDAPQTNNVLSDRKVTNSASYKQENSAESSVQPADNKGAQTIQTAVEIASSEVNTEPTTAQAEAGNYKKGHVTIGEFDITIENPAGSVRKGVDADGKEWSTTMANAYGYINGTEGVDGDHIDVFLHQNMDEWNGRKVYVVDQTNTDGSFDEHKVMLGFNEEGDALSAYLANYDKTWADTHPGIRISETNIEDFNKWVQSSHRKTKPFADYSSVSKITNDTPTESTTATSGKGYKVEPKPYTNKQGKTLDTYLVTFDRDFSKEELSALRAKVKALKGWYDRESKGWMLRSVDDAKAFAEEVATKSEDEVADEAPLSISDLGKPADTPVKKVDVASATDALKAKGEAKLSDHAGPVESPKPKKRRWISDEDADEFNSLRDNLRNHFGKGNDVVQESGTDYGQPKPKQMDAEVLRMGTRMTYLMMKGGLRSFSDYCEAMKDELPDIFDEMRPHLKSLYAAAQNMEEVIELGWDEEMDDRKTVKAFDVYNFDKPGAKDIIATAQHIVDENASQQQTDQIIQTFKGERNKKTEVQLRNEGTGREGHLFGDSALFKRRENQLTSLVAEIGLGISERADTGNALTMRDVKKMAQKYSELKDISDTDLQELVELSMTKLAKTVAMKDVHGSAEEQKTAFDKIVSYYNAQPRLNARDSERLMKQQYSTPTPFGFVMGQFVHAGGKEIGSMLEPSAGNGALTITMDPSVVHVNDIDDVRLSNLRKLGFGKVTAQDALLPFSGQKVDAVMTNPPFGTVTEKVYEGVFHISSLEGQMAINALEQMKDDGRAAIIIGGNTNYRTNGSMNPKDAAFFGYLYSRYNVADVINISGKALYSRNGTGYDVRMILIDGRKTGELRRVYPPVKAKARAEQITTFEELYKRVQDDIQQIQQVGNRPADVRRESGTATDGVAGTPVRRGDNHPNSGSGQRPSATSDVVRGPSQPDSGQSGSVDDGIRTAGVDNADGGNGASPNDVQRSDSLEPGQGELDNGLDNGRGGSGDDRRDSASSRPDGDRKRLAVKTGLGDEKVPYSAQSNNGFTLMSVVPAAQAEVLQKSLAEIGDVDEYLVNELGYSSKDELYGYLAAEQIDSVALAIRQMNKGNAFIIGDMTGVGKGRQGAALIRYAVRQGKCPIYFTQKPTLFSDNYRDLADIGSGNLRPFIMASVDKERSGDIVDSDGNVVYKIPSQKEKERVYRHILAHGTLPPEYDYVLATYSQIQNGESDYRQNEDGTWSKEARKLPKKSKGYTPADKNGQVRRDALAKLAKGNIAILDESHTVGGDSGCGHYMQMLTSSAAGITFLSATFAKRADNMPIYAQRTVISEAGIKASELIEAIKKGGVTLQEISSRQLVESEQMVRRERSFEGVAIDWLSVKEETDRKQRAQFDEVAAIFNAIRNFQDEHVTPIIDARNEAAAEWGAAVGHTRGTKDMGIKNVPFASKMYNLVNQLLFALKVDAVADRVVENLRNGFKPVISFTNTMEGFLSSAPKGVAMDKTPNFSMTLMRALDGVMRFTEKDADNKTEGRSISLSELSADGQKAYNAIRDKIMNLSAELPISPMDAIRMKIEDAGYSVSEITGRELQLNRTDEGKYIVESRKDRDKKAVVRDFNSGKLDVLMINKSGSTGISLHASSKFEDQRPRVMVFAQFQSDINDEIQMRGRIDRSGQVTRGRYEYIMSTIPAEQRIQMMFKAKLKSLDANTTSSQKSKFNEMEVVDFLNKYGDEVVWEYMKEHPELEERLGDPLDMLQGSGSEDGPRASEKENTKKKEDCAGKISRHLAFLSVDEQDEVFREITEAYRVKMQLLDDAGENDLEITTMPLRAETKRRQIWHEGVNPGSGNAFADNTYVEEAEVDVLKKPMKRSEIIEASRKLAGDAGTVTEYDQMRYGSKEGELNWTRYVREKGGEISQFYHAKADETVSKLKEAGEARMAKAREKAVESAIKARGRGENNFTDTEIQSLADTVAEEQRVKEEYKQNKRRDEIMGVNQRIQSLLNRLRAGNIYVVPQDLKQSTPEMFSQTFGTFVGFRFNKSYTLGSSTAIFATLDGRRKVELALNDPAVNTIISATEIAHRYSPKDINSITMENWDEKVPTQTRQRRYIITGNILQALVDVDKGEKTRGNLISYSTIDGETRQGILMGENFKLTDLRNGAPLSSRLAQMRKGEAVVSENGDVKISKEAHNWLHRGEYELRVPKSKQRGGIYTTHPDLLKLVENHNFTTKGNHMIAYVREGNLSRVVDMLSRVPFNVTVLEKSELADMAEEPAAGYRGRRRPTATGRSLFDWADGVGVRTTVPEKSLFDWADSEPENAAPRTRDEVADQVDADLQKAAQEADEALDRYSEAYAEYLEKSRILESQLDDKDTDDALREGLMSQLEQEENRLKEEREALAGSLREYYVLNNTAEDAKRIADDKVCRIEAEVAVWQDRQRILEDILDGVDDKDIVVPDSGRGEETHSAEVKTGGGRIEYSAQGHLPDAEAGEFAYVERQFSRTGEFSFTGGGRIMDRGDVAYMFRALEDYSIENVFAVLVKDGRPTVLHIGMGTPTSSPADMGAIRAGVDAFGADKVYLVHNHPSGIMRSSAPDRQLMRSLEEAFGDELETEGIIIDTTSGRYVTFNGSGSEEVYDRPKTADGKEDEADVYRLDHADRSRMPEDVVTIKFPSDVSDLLKTLRFGGKEKVSYLILNHGNQVIGNIHSGYTSLEDAGLADELASAATRYGGTSVIVYGNVNLSGARKLNKEVKRASLGGVQLLDTISVENGEHRSAMDAGTLWEAPAPYRSEAREPMVAGRGREDFEAMRERAAAERGLVMPGLNEAEVRVVDVPRHDFEEEKPIAEARKWAKENIVGEHWLTDSKGSAVPYTISRGAVDKYLSESSIGKSDNLGVHLSVLKKLPKVISESIEAEVHPDYNKGADGIRHPKNGYNKANLVHRFYGFVNIGGESYRVKTTIIESGTNDIMTKPHSFEVTNIELLSEDNSSKVEPTATGYNGQLPHGIAKLLKGVEKSYDPGKKLLDESKSQTEVGDDIRYRLASNARQQEMAQTSPEAKQRHAEKLAEKFGTQVRIVSDVEELRNSDPEMQRRLRRSKGFFDPATGAVVVVLPNNANVEDVAETVFHEVVAHKGLRELVGEENYDAFCDEIYGHLKDDLKEEVDRDSARRFMNEPEKGYGHARRVAVDELFGRMAEKGFEDFTKAERGIWAKLKAKVLEAINKFLGSLRLPKWVKLGDNELRYLLWRSHERLGTLAEARGLDKNGVRLGDDYVDMARDAAKREELGLNKTEVIRSSSGAKTTADKIEESFNAAVAGNLKGKPVEIGRLTKEGKAYLEKLSGLKLKENVKFKLNPSDLVHIYKDHFGDNEKDLGQNIPLTKNDIRKIADILAHPDKVLFGTEKGGDNRKMFFFLKSDGVTGAYNLLEIYANAWGNLTSKSFYRTKKSVSQRVLSLMKSEHLTSVTDGPTLNSDANLPNFFETTTTSGDESFDFRFRDVSNGAARQEYDRRVRISRKGNADDKKAEKPTNRAAQLHEAYLDGMRSLRVLQEAVSHETGSRIESHEDAYEFENQMSSRNKAAEEEYAREYVKPMFDAIADICKGKDRKKRYSELVRYVFAKHGLERNAFMRDRDIANGVDRNKADSRDYAGLTSLTGENDVAEAELAAARIVADYEAAVETAGLWDSINAATKATLNARYVSGLLSRDMYDTIRTQYRFYIPMKGWEDTVAADVYEYSGGGYGLRPALMKAFGRNSVADDPFATIVADAQRTIMEANRNIMKQRFLNLALNHRTDLLTVSKQWYVRQPDGSWIPDNPVIPADADADMVDSIIKQHEADMLALELQKKARTRRSGLQLGLRTVQGEYSQHLVQVKRNGEVFCVYVNGDPRAARAINGMLNPDAGDKTRIAEIAQSIKNFMSRAFTSWNPEFTVGNLSRDLMFAEVAVLTKEDARYARKYTANIAKLLGRMPGLLYKWRHGTLDENNDMERYFKEFLRNGGETGFTQLNTVDKVKKDMERFIREAQGGVSGLPAKAWRGFWNGVEFMNRAAEDATRFAVYVTSRQSGRTISRCVSDAKEITVNFNRKGSGAFGTRQLNFIYVFFNACMQSMANAGRLIKRHPVKASAAMATFLAAGFLIPTMVSLYASLCGGDDDYWNLPEWTRRNNICIAVPFTKMWLTIPISHELRPFYAIGEIAYNVMNGKETTEDGLVKGVEAFSGIMPVDWTGNGGDNVVNFAPTIAQPLVQVGRNVDYFGKPIYRKTPWNEDEPEWSKAYKGTSGLLVDLSKMLSEANSTTDEYGVTQYPRRWYEGDVNPAVVEHLAESYSGGLGKTINGAAKTISMLWYEDARELRNVPVARKFFTRTDDRSLERRETEEFFKLKREYEDLQKYRSKLMATRKQDPLRADEKISRWRDSERGQRYAMLRGYMSRIDALENSIRNSMDENHTEELKVRVDNLRRKLIEEASSERQVNR